MREPSAETMNQGAQYGIVAGIVFAGLEVTSWALMGRSPLMPIRMMASVVLGEAALQTTPLEVAMIVGIVVHLAISAGLGALYTVLNARFSTITQTRWERQIVCGLLFGALIWGVDIQLIARGLFPWFYFEPQGPQLVAHVLGFGLPLALFYANAERRIHHVGRWAATT